MVHSGVCNNFINTPVGKYRPLACKPMVVQTKELTKHAYANRVELFFVGKQTTIREHSTLDLLYPSPLWLRNEVEPRPIVVSGATRITADGDVRIIDTGLIRVIA